MYYEGYTYVLLNMSFYGAVSLRTGNQEPSQFKSLDFIHSDSFVVCTAFSRLVQLVNCFFHHAINGYRFSSHTCM